MDRHDLYLRDAHAHVYKINVSFSVNFLFLCKQTADNGTSPQSD